RLWARLGDIGHLGALKHGRLSARLGTTRGTTRSLRIAGQNVYRPNLVGHVDIGIAVSAKRSRIAGGQRRDGQQYESNTKATTDRWEQSPVADTYHVSAVLNLFEPNILRQDLSRPQ